MFKVENALASLLDTETIIGLRFSAGPFPDVVALRLTLPENPFTLDMVSCEVCEEFWTIVNEDGLADSVKSGGGGRCDTATDTIVL
jgi:hypothetical protein